MVDVKQSVVPSDLAENLYVDKNDAQKGWLRSRDAQGLAKQSVVPSDLAENLYVDKNDAQKGAGDQ